MPNLKIEDCQLEWDRERGVLYVHNKETGCSVLRITGLPEVGESAQIRPGDLIDVRIGGYRGASPEKCILVQVPRT